MNETTLIEVLKTVVNKLTALESSIEEIKTLCSSKNEPQQQVISSNDERPAYEQKRNCITEKQFKFIMYKMHSLSNRSEVEGLILKKYGIVSFRDIPFKKCNEVLEFITSFER
jgi:hypothetical protein